MEVDAKRQANEKTEPLLEKGYRCVGKRVVKNKIDTLIVVAKTVSNLLSLDKEAVVMELDKQRDKKSARSVD